MLKVKYHNGEIPEEGEDVIVWPDGTTENGGKDEYHYDRLCIRSWEWELKSIGGSYKIIEQRKILDDLHIMDYLRYVI